MKSDKISIIHSLYNSCRQYSKYFASLCKLWFAFISCILLKQWLYKKEIWLIREKGTEARDNGYHLYKYIRENKPEINAFYVIKKGSPDFSKIKAYGNTIYLNSLKHYIYYLCAKASINSQPWGACPEPTRKIFMASRKLHRKDQIVIHLKHGITKDELSHDLDYKNTGYDFICCASERERRFMQETHGYPDDCIKALGFCRFDNLLRTHDTKRQILIMPTFRKWLYAADVTKEATVGEKETFQNTEFYKTYETLLCDEQLVQTCKEKGYKVIFYPHYALQSFVNCFDNASSDVVTIADRAHYDVQQLLLESALLITDYSSVFFDFAYMKKPVIFFQFDVEQYRSGHYKKGYFDYKTDGFGVVVEKESELINEIKQLLENNCVMDDVYQKRVDDFFTVRDTNNCKRIFKEVYRKANKK